MPPPELSSAAWVNAILDRSWREVVQCVFFVSSTMDKKATSDVSPLQRFMCTLCSHRPCFPSSRALQSHQRSKHGQRNPVRAFVFNSICPVCGTDFRARLRCVAHLSDVRRPQCRTELLSGSFPAVPRDRLCVLDAEDNKLRKAARRQGRSHHIAAIPAMTATGKIVGRTVAAGHG
eukprot:6671825-Karenia_brevis.AAC.1